MKSLRVLCLCTLAALLSACSSAPGTTGEAMVFYGRGVKGPVCPLPALTSERREMVTVEYQEKKQTLIALTKSSPSALSVTFLTANFIKLLEVNYADGIVTSTRFVPQKLPFEPEQIVSDILLMQADTAAIATVLPTGWRIEEKADERVIMNERGEAVIVLTKTAITHRAFGYSVSVKTLP